jgi:hypothetical protein
MEQPIIDLYRQWDAAIAVSRIPGVAPHYLTAEMVLDMTKSDTDAVWRVEELHDGRVETTYIGFYPIDYDRVIYYEDSSKLPEWINDRVAVLRMMPCNPTTSIVFGVGRRISESVFWVVEGDN